MKLKYWNIGIVVMMALVMINCKSSKKDSTSSEQSTMESPLVFLNKAEAEKQIIQDKTDGFFESITPADMSIQLKKSDMPSSVEESKLLYQELLKSDMEDFTESDKAFMHEVFDSAKAAIDLINPKLMPSVIELIKTKINHYGPNVYYTREDAIILPNNIFTNPSVEAQMPVMLHEIFHLLSRYNDEFRDEMYALIGFSKFEENLVIADEVSEMLLTNPDGVRRDYAINLKDENGVEQLAVPLILSTKKRYESSMPSFFAYLSFDLFPLVKTSENEYALGLNPKGESALTIGHNGDFFKQIKDNTQYIIHPDEIMADNFMMAVIANRDNTYKGFSEEGTQLLKDVLEILKRFK